MKDHCETELPQISQDAAPGVRWIAIHPLGNGGHDHAEYGRSVNRGLSFPPQHLLGYVTLWHGSFMCSLYVKRWTGP